MRVLIVSPSDVFFEEKSALLTAPSSESPLILCAAQSAEISLHGMPHTFSVYVLKKMRYRRSPNRLRTQSSNERSGLRGNNRAHP